MQSLALLRCHLWTHAFKNVASSSAGLTAQSERAKLETWLASHLPSTLSQLGGRGTIRTWPLPPAMLAGRKLSSRLRRCAVETAVGRRRQFRRLRNVCLRTREALQPTDLHMTSGSRQSGEFVAGQHKISTIVAWARARPACGACSWANPQARPVPNAGDIPTGAFWDSARPGVPTSWVTDKHE